MRENVVFKGNKSGLQLMLNETADFEVILKQLKAKLESATQFFTSGTTVKVPPSVVRLLTAEQREQLIDLFAGYGLNWKEVSSSEQAKPNQPLVKKEPEKAKPHTVIITKMIRNGQVISHSGSIVIIGDVNPGAKVIAGGDIVIYGTCRGVAHAGANGDEQATITANKLLASQLRIAGLIARAPDKLDEPQHVETARIKDGAVIIEPANKLGGLFLYG